ncbi:sensor histidine kinase [Nocardiopsis composta]|uniref:Signal transduction histidine kinase n=1 Tax=Nocardiopsis composta TaxID=157465 RepID=A0A7W8QKX2_9ACTN|nr:sensor histidine kinase [Nocardiopsis composta]MBB5432328.1 signal transduction histidine kinase [Nocardiopsis composta]
MSSSAHATLPRLASLVRLLLQLRMLLAAFALLLIPGERLTPPTFLLILSFALLSGLAARYWERFVPYLREHPLLITLDVCLTSSVLVIEGPSGPVFIITVITAAVCGILYGVRGATLVVLLQILCYTLGVALYAFTHGRDAPVEVMSFQALLIHPALYPIAAYTGSKVRAVLAELAEEQEARKQAELTAAAAEERDRLARDMHDSVAKTLRGAAMAAQALPLWLQKDPERAAGIAAQVADAADTASAEARALISDLRDEDAGSPFTELVERAVRDWAAQSGIAASTDLPEESPEPAFIARRECIAVLKEALTNVQRHSGARSVSVALAVQDGRCTLSIADDGDGFAVPYEEVMRAERGGNGHYGLLGMAERAERAGGSLDVSSAPGEGAVLRVTVPVMSASPPAPTSEKS